MPGACERDRGGRRCLLMQTIVILSPNVHLCEIGEEQQMNLGRMLMVSATTVLGLAMLLPGSAMSQQKPLKDQLIGFWTFVSSTGKLLDGSPYWGSNPKGLLNFTENARF